MSSDPSKPEMTYYDSEYLADYYESLWTDHPALVDDADLYWKHAKSAIQHTSPDSQNPFLILDVGTGTGRIIRALLERLMESKLVPLGAVKFFGVDPSPYMLDQARKGAESFADAGISWLQGKAHALGTLPGLVDFSGRFHLMIFSFSGINHLVESSEVGEFVCAAGKLLRRNGTLLLSVCIPLLDRVHAEEESHPYGQVKEVSSKSIPGVIYREWETGHGVEGDFFVNSLITEAVKKGQDGVEEILERRQHKVPLRLLSRSVLEDAIRGLSLSIEREEWLHDQVIFVIKAS